ncbi:MAG: hypothetical protein K2I79_00075, partial [Clostridia bacterium]|nr:hypothetical protein [Clostridia bacterium]
LHNSSLVLDAQAAAIDELLYTLAGIHLDIVDVSGAIYLINGKIELGAKIYDGIPTSAGVNSLNISLGIALSENSEERVAQMRAEIAEIDANAVELDFTNGKTLSQTVMNVLGGLSLKLDVKLTLPEGVFGVGNLLKSFGIDIADTNAFELVISGGNMQLDASLVAKAAFDYNNPNNTVVMLEIVMNSDAVFGGYDGESNVVFHAGDTVMGIYIKGSELYVDLSNFTLLGIEFPVYYTDNFNIQGFINYLLDKTIGNLDSTLFGEFAVSANYGATATEFAWAKEEGADAYMIKLNGVALSRISAYGADGSVSEKYTYSIDNSKLSGVYNVEVVPMVKKVTETDGKEQVNYVDLGKRIGRYTNKFAVNISRDSDNNVIFGWNRISGVDYYAILLNGNQVATVTKTEWVSSELTGGETISVIPYKYSSDKYVRVNDYIGIAQYSVTQPEVSKAATLDSLGENELLLLGVSRDQINMTVSLSAIQTIMSALNMDVSLGEYVGVIDLTFKPSEDWLSISFEGLLGDAYGGEVTKGELALSVFDIYNGSNAEQFKRELHGLDVWNALSEKKDSAYRNIVDGLLEKILNLSGTIDISVTGDTALNMSNIFNHIFAQIPELADMNFAEDIMLELAGLNLQLALNLGIDIDSVENTVVAVELNDTTNGLDTLLGIYVYQGKLIIDASGIAFGKYSVEGTALFNSLFDMVGDLVKGLRDATDMDGLMDMIYGLLEPKSDDNSSVAVADEGMRGNMPEGSHSIGVRVSVNANEGTTTFSWDSVPNAMRYRLSVYSGYDLATKTNILGNGGLVPVGNTVIDGNFTIRENSITFKTEELNAIGLVKDSMSAFDGILQSGYYYFVVEAVRIRGENTVVPLYDDDGKVLNGVYTNFNVIKTILGMVKIKNDKISLTATAGMLNKLLAGALGINLDWISLILDIDLFDGVGNLDIEISDGK